jgi:hypothetical protein
MWNELDQLIARLDEGTASPAELERVRELLAALEKAEPLPLAGAIRDEAGEPDVSGEVAGKLGFESLPVAEAVRDEAGEIDVADDVLAMLIEDMPLAEAVRAELAGDLPLFGAVFEEAGRIEIADSVLAKLGLAAPKVPVAEAVRGEAGSVELADEALAGIDPSWPIAEAVRAEAGEIDIADAVMSQVGNEAWVSALLDRELSQEEHVRSARRLMADKAAGRDMTDFAEIGRIVRAQVVAEAGAAPSLWAGVAAGIGVADPEKVEGWDETILAEAVRAEAGTVDVTAEVMRRVRRAAVAPQISLLDAEEPLEPANNGGFAWGAVAVAALVLLTVLLGKPFVGGLPERIERDGSVELAALQFASPGEIVVDDLSYAPDTNVQVIQEEGEGGALIIWVEEETL